MSAERNPHDEQSWLAAPLASLTDWLLGRPGTVVGVTIGLAAVSLLITVCGLEFRTSRLDLLNPRATYNQRWLKYLDEFGEGDDAVVVFQGPGPERLIPAMDTLTAELEQDPHFTSVLARRDLSRLEGKQLHFLTADQLAGIEQFVARFAPAAGGDARDIELSRLVRTANDQLEQSLLVPPHQNGEKLQFLARGQLEQLTAGLASAMLPEPLYRSPWPIPGEPRAEGDLEGGGSKLGVQQASSFASQHLLEHDGQLGFVLARFASQGRGLARGTEAIGRLRQTIANVRHAHPDVTIGLTGMAILEHDEMTASQGDTLLSTLLSLVGVAVLFFAGFGSWRHPIAAVGVLVLAMAISFAFVTLFVGHLNILSVSFGAMLIGLGIDYGIFIVARYLQLRATSADCREVLVETVRSVGPGILTGAVTTALAFFCTALTDFTGVAELGIVAGGGILICVGTTFAALPAMIFLADRGRRDEAVPAVLSLDSVFTPIWNRARGTVFVTAALTILLACGARHLRYDHNLLNMQPRGLESAELERMLSEDSERSVWFAVSMAEEPEKIRALKARFEELPSVVFTEDLVSWLPPNDPALRKRAAWIHDTLAANANVQDTDEVAPDVAELAAQLARSVTLLSAVGGDTVARAHRLRSAVLATESAPALHRYQQQLVGDVRARLARILAMSDPEPPTLDDLPAPLRDRFLGAHHKHLLKVYARGDIWDMEALERFVRDVENVDPLVTGHPVQTFYASRDMQRSYRDAALYALIAVAIALMLDFRSVRGTILGLTPLLIGTVQLFGFLGWYNVPLNAANMIALPLLLGIGVDYGVHIVHESGRRQRGTFRLASSTTTAIVLTSTTTMVGFGSMMIARHRGLQSLGQVLTIGVFCCMITSLIAFPALLAWLSEPRSRREARSEEIPSEPVPSEAVPAEAVPSEPSIESRLAA